MGFIVPRRSFCGSGAFLRNRPRSSLDYKIGWFRKWVVLQAGKWGQMRHRGTTHDILSQRFLRFWKPPNGPSYFIKKFQKNSKKIQNFFDFFLNFFLKFFWFFFEFFNFFFEKFKKCMHERWRKINDRGCQIKRNVFKNGHKMATYHDTHTFIPLAKINDFTRNWASIFGYWSLRFFLKCPPYPRTG